MAETASPTEAAHQQVSTAIDSEEAAAALARSAVEARLAACAQVIGPIRSVYRWEGRIDVAQEWLVVCKTTADRSEELVGYLGEQHPYDVPEVICTPVTAGNPGYLAWVSAETRPTA
ncbi:MAG TPA: divalent-cation tolerance protein CutA [Pilimelia sp.]|nr:divalent-cation tolerance protein CutA [Pilimelia sp.]